MFTKVSSFGISSSMREVCTAATKMMFFAAILALNLVTTLCAVSINIHEHNVIIS